MERRPDATDRLVVGLHSALIFLQLVTGRVAHKVDFLQDFAGLVVANTNALNVAVCVKALNDGMAALFLDDELDFGVFRSDFANILAKKLAHSSRRAAPVTVPKDDFCAGLDEAAHAVLER